MTKNRRDEAHYDAPNDVRIMKPKDVRRDHAPQAGVPPTAIRVDGAWSTRVGTDLLGRWAGNTYPRRCHGMERPRRVRRVGSAQRPATGDRLAQRCGKATLRTTSRMAAGPPTAGAHHVLVQIATGDCRFQS